ncbi:hypothetical protein N836_35090 [Leptolyngbya sp. Heron Island J]|uniref:hypothetical protein n=1 Tax=Leptolyngbya sp. Heron Island J TaxID=1385935 RepID=UPI0003B99804|nr:hypothetical protein [Leptolyngbya sp. Heron Island J]ESA37847.1 hypothetical protein N836_35090 [Leptolyngbya sp. Heron Island J]
MFLKSLIHDLRTYVWGVTTNHPCWRETKFGWIWPIEVQRRKSAYGYSFQIWFCWPQVHVLNPFELEADYLLRGGKRHV